MTFTEIAQSRLWWVLLAGLLLAGLMIYLTGYNTGFEANDPLANNLDETWLYQEAFEMYRVPESERRLAGCPPGTLWFMQLAHLLVGNADVPRPVQTLNLMRLWVAVVNVATVGIIALIGRRLHSPLTGLVAASAWLMSPLIVLRVRYALTEPFYALAISLAVYFCVRALQDQSHRAAIASTVAGLAAVVFKYSVFSALGFGVGATLWFLLTGWPANSRSWGRTMLIQIVLIALCAGWLFFGYDTLSLTDTSTTGEFLDSDLTDFQLTDFVRVLTAAIEQAGFQLLPFIGLFTAGTVLFLRQKSNPLRYFWLMAVVFVCAHLTLILFYIVYWIGVQRYTTPTTPVVVLLAAVCLVLTGEWVLVQIRLRRQFVRHAALILLAALWVVPMAQTTIREAQERSVPRIEMPFMDWMGRALPSGTIIMPEESNLWWHTDVWFGYDGPLRPWVIAPLTTHSIQEWRDMHVDYAYLADWRRDLLLQTDEAYLNNLVQLKHFPPANEQQQWRGETFSVYYLADVGQRVDVIFGQQIMLRSYTLDKTEAAPGEAITVQPFWQAVAHPEEDYAVFLHLVPQDSNEIIAQDDKSPAQPTYPPTSWTDPDEIIVGQTLTITLPEDVSPGVYRLIAGLYDRETSERLTNSTGTDYVVLDEITIALVHSR